MSTLYYIHDPMCSWCWGFNPIWEKLKAVLPEGVKVHYLLGGLATDTLDIMPLSMQHKIKSTWQQIQIDIPNTQFNYDFWRNNIPQRSTYIACRAVIAARTMNPSLQYKMLYDIQSAYYLQALNPSDLHVLIGLAKNIHLDEVEFKRLMLSEEVQQELDKEICLSKKLGVFSYPSLVLHNSNTDKNVTIDIHYTDHQVILDTLLHHLKGRHQ